MPVFFSTEKKCKTKTRTTAKLQKLPTAKLIEIAVANRNFFSHNLEIALTYCVLKHSKHFQIENDVYEIGKSAICWLGFCFKFQFLRSYTINITQLAIETEGEFSWFPLRIYRKINVKSGGKNEPLWWNEQNTAHFKHEYHNRMIFCQLLMEFHADVRSRRIA